MIRFRGKRLDNGKWVKGLPTRYPADATKVNAILLDDYYENDFGMVCGHVEKVDPSTVGMGVEIDGKWYFEGDIVSSKGRNWIVKFKNDKYYIGWIATDEMELSYIHLWYDDIKIIGNKWDNPELLGGQDAQRD
jgi:hypothetical protein